MSAKDELDVEIALAEELLGKIAEITLYRDKYKELCEELGQSEIQIYRGMKVFTIDEDSPKGGQA